MPYTSQQEARIAKLEAENANLKEQLAQKFAEEMSVFQCSDCASAERKHRGIRSQTEKAGRMLKQARGLLVLTYVLTFFSAALLAALVLS